MFRRKAKRYFFASPDTPTNSSDSNCDTGDDSSDNEERPKLRYDRYSRAWYHQGNRRSREYSPNSCPHCHSSRDPFSSEHHTVDPSKKDARQSGGPLGGNGGREGRKKEAWEKMNAAQQRAGGPHSVKTNAIDQAQSSETYCSEEEEENSSERSDETSSELGASDDGNVAKSTDEKESSSLAMQQSSPNRIRQKIDRKRKVIDDNSAKALLKKSSMFDIESQPREAISGSANSEITMEYDTEDNKSDVSEPNAAMNGPTPPSSKEQEMIQTGSGGKENQSNMARKKKGGTKKKGGKGGKRKSTAAAASKRLTSILSNQKKLVSDYRTLLRQLKKSQKKKKKSKK